MGTLGVCGGCVFRVNANWCRRVAAGPSRSDRVPVGRAVGRHRCTAASGRFAEVCGCVAVTTASLHVYVGHTVYQERRPQKDQGKGRAK